jgi:hypothetical protein
MSADATTRVASRGRVVRVGVREGIVLVSVIGALGSFGCERQPSDDFERPHPEAAGAESTSTLRLEPAAPPAPAGEGVSPSAARQPGSSAASRRTLDGAPGTVERAGPTEGAPSPTCVKGWSSPPPGSPLRRAALDMMRSSPGERFVVTDIRYFVGPEDAEVLRPQGDVERWYVKGYSQTDPRRRQRWLVRRATVGRGVDAIAPYSSRGYGPNTWKRVGATEEGLSDPFQRPCDKTRPGDKCMGLPREVLGCLEGT